MVRAEDFGKDIGFFEPGPERRRNAKIIDPPPDIPLPAIVELAPPGVMPFVFMKLTEGVDETAFNNMIEAGPFFVREPVALVIRVRMRQIDFGVRDIEVAAKNHRFLFF